MGVLARAASVAVALVALVALVAGCGQAPAPSGSAGVLAPTAYDSDLAAATRTRGFDLSPAGGVTPAVGVGAAVAASAGFRPPGEPVAVHLALVSTPGFGSLDFSDPSHARDHVLSGTPTWVVVYHGQEDGIPGVWVVFVDATTGEAKAMVGFGANLTGGAPCPNGRCIFE